MSARSTVPVVMTVGGFDPSSGAGVTADLKTMAFFGCYGVAAVTALTYQNTSGVYGVRAETAQSVAKQMDLLLSDFDVAAVKTGMLASSEIAEVIGDRIESAHIPIVVVDPVITSTSGADLAGDSAQTSVRRLFPLASVVTPNLSEARALAEIDVRDASSMEEAARRILKTGPQAVAITGGDLENGRSDARVIDLMVDAESVVAFEGERIASMSTHGTGCAFASAIASLLAHGMELRAAIETAKAYVREAIRTASGLGAGRGPLNHFPPGFTWR